VRRYAEDTSVSPQKTRCDIEDLLRRNGAREFAFMDDGNMAAVAFTLGKRAIRVQLPYPHVSEFAKTDSGNTRSHADQAARREQAIKARWRALLLIIKAKLEAVASGITTLEREFMPDVVLPNGQTLGVWALPAVERALESGQMPSLPAALNARSEE
jgi:hypothetical protein